MLENDVSSLRNKAKSKTIGSGALDTLPPGRPLLPTFGGAPASEIQGRISEWGESDSGPLGCADACRDRY